MENSDDHSEDWTMILIAITGIVALFLFVDWAMGPRYHSQTGLGETLRGEQHTFWDGGK